MAQDSNLTILQRAGLFTDTSKLSQNDLARIESLTPEEITLLNPNTGTCPVFRSRRSPPSHRAAVSPRLSRRRVGS